MTMMTTMTRRRQTYCNHNFSSSGWRVVAFMVLGIIATTTPTTHALATTTTDFIDCSSPCNGGDVNYELTANVRIIPNMYQGKTYKGRTYSQEGDPTFMGPTMYVQPGQSLWIKFRNNLTDPTLGPSPPNAESYWNMLQRPGEKIKYQFYKRNVDNYTQMKVDVPNIPSHFDATNLHLHGLDVAVHMFDPVGTHDPMAPHIAIHPGQCYCYRFDIPDHHPTGLYWYHPHLHGATAIQMWSGMIGLLYVQDGKLEQELQHYGIGNPREFIIWDPAFKAVVNASTHDIEVDEFLMGQTTLSKIHPFLVNGQENPTFDVVVGEVLWLRVLCGTVENENTFIIYPQGREDEPWDDVAIPFWVFASDGVTYSKPKRKHIMVMAGGMREELLLLFDTPGTYTISQQGIQGMQFFDMMGHPHDQILATIEVKAKDDEAIVNSERTILFPNTPIDDIQLTPGYDPEEDIDAVDIVHSETIVFSMGTNRDQAPFPQYYINGKAFNGNRLDFMAAPGQAREYILINANHNVHPFHIHVNRFQIQEMGSELSTEKYPVLKHVMEFDPTIWRDSVVVPPNGRARIWIQYKNYTGKTVFHCHFLAHEDTGMMATLFIGEPIERWMAIAARHTNVIIGVVTGMCLMLGFMVMILGVRFSKKRTTALAGYEVAEMNELKAKVID